MTKRVTSNLQHGDGQIGNDRLMYSFVKNLRKAEHTRSYIIHTTGSGWEVREVQDSEIVRQTHYQDWHRVERARNVFVIKFASLRAEGWQEI